jgi:hypothetical protein
LIGLIRWNRTTRAPGKLPTCYEALSDARGRALVDMHMKLCDLLLTRHAGTIVFPKRFLPKEKWNRGAKAEIEKHVAILDKHLTGDRVASR